MVKTKLGVLLSFLRAKKVAVVDPGARSQQGSHAHRYRDGSART